ncbi:hypothetical protein NBM05_03870 [Rothia sp. AR01]|uniref:Uncharacterized protein n=1 Tax=Rothia santali TaxID=2949643 RepID=A0A9X2KHR1_9MICC|nr:hypothetical protein [Rothia santali]MCP3425185.1 hypothetical protein [Rothia santali]
MRLTQDELEAWADQFYAQMGQPRTWSVLAADAGFKYITLNVQRKQNRIDPGVIIHASRAYGHNPLSELARVQRFAEVAPPGAIPDPRVLAATMNPGYVYREIGNRALRADQPQAISRAAVYDAQMVQGEEWISYPHRFAIWLDVATPRGSREVMAEALGLKTKPMSMRLNGSAEFRIDEIIEGAQALGLDPVLGLVLGGYIEPQEAGYSESLRVDAIRGIADDQLLEIAQVQARYLQGDLQDLKVLDEHSALN